MTSPSPDEAEARGPKKAWYLQWWVWGIAAVLVIGAFGQALGGGQGDDEPGRGVASAPTATPDVEMVTVPDLSGRTGDEAASELRGLDLLHDFESDDGSMVLAPSNWTVAGTDPAAGASVAAGSTVVIDVTKPDGTTATPRNDTPATPEPTDAVSLAETVWADVQANFPDGITSDSPLFAVTEIEDVSAGTIRVYVQENLTDDGREEVARHVFNLGAWDNTDLTVVVVRDASGIDSNHYRRDFPYLPQ